MYRQVAYEVYMNGERFYIEPLEIVPENISEDRMNTFILPQYELSVMVIWRVERPESDNPIRALVGRLIAADVLFKYSANPTLIPNPLNQPARHQREWYLKQ